MAVSRSRLARVLGPILIFLGTLLIAAGIAGPLYVADKLKTIPLDIDITTIAQAQKTADATGDADFPARALDLCSYEAKKAVINDVAVTAQTRTLVTAPSDKSSMTVQSGSSIIVPSVKTKAGVKHPALAKATDVKRDCGDGLVLAWTDRVSLDRRTAAPNEKISEAVFTPGESPTVDPIKDRKGLQYRFPAGTTKDGGYSFFDMVTRSNIKLDFVDEQEVSGTKTLHLRGSQDWVDLSTIKDARGNPLLGTEPLQKASSWWGITDTDKPVTLNRWATTAVDLWVDPTTGIIIDQGVHYRQQFRQPAKVSPEATRAEREFKLDVFDANLRWTQDTVRAQAETAKAQQDRLALASKVAPIVGGVLGVLALALGGFAVYLGRNAAPAGGPAGGSGAWSAPTLQGGRRRREDRTAGHAPPLDDDPTAVLGADEQTSVIGTDEQTAVIGEDPVTEAFSAQPRPDDARTEAIDFRKPDER